MPPVAFMPDLSTPWCTISGTLSFSGVAMDRLVKLMLGEESCPSLQVNSLCLGESHGFVSTDFSPEQSFDFIFCQRFKPHVGLFVGAPSSAETSDRTRQSRYQYWQDSRVPRGWPLSLPLSPCADGLDSTLKLVTPPSVPASERDQVRC
jgi:hypothetical protein